MESVQGIQRSSGPVVRGKELAELTLLYDPTVMLVTAPMPPGADAMRHAEELVAAGPRPSKVEVETPDGVPVAGALDRLSDQDGLHAKAWVSYLEEVTTVFAHLVGARVVGVRQIVAEGPHCPRFHVDKILARGVLNVLGPCTEWLDAADADRPQRANPETLLVFKGTAWPDAAERVIVHRSPPADGNRRVMLTLDWLD